MKTPRGWALFGAVASLLAGCSLLGIPTSQGDSSTNGATYVGDGTSTSASTGAGAAPPRASASHLLGSACTSDDDCGDVLECIKATDNDPVFGGPAGGFCTMPCDSDTDCPGAGSACFKAAEDKPGRCTLTCTLGPKLTELEGTFTEDKCRGRDDLRCHLAKGAGALCVPTCGRDQQCGPGRACDPRRSVCVDMKSTGLPTGSPCSPLEHPTPCAGVCVGFNSGVTMCSSPCVLGDALLDSDNCGGPEKGLCAFRPDGNGAGDFGFCTPSCSKHDDCQNPAFFCFSIPLLTANFNKGYCFAPLPCPGGQSDCKDAQGNPLPYTCTDTAFGPYCLDLAYPLGDAAPTSGAGGAGGVGGAAP